MTLITEEILWKDRVDEFIEVSKECIKIADFVKVSDEELKLISGQANLDKGVEVAARYRGWNNCSNFRKRRDSNIKWT